MIEPYPSGRATENTFFPANKMAIKSALSLAGYRFFRQTKLGQPIA
jgi:hypothetical protein